MNADELERAESGTDGAGLLLDGTDNLETRYLINDLAVKTSRPWVYGGAVGSTGLCLTVIPNETPCLRCVFDEAPPPDLTPTCDTVGVLASAVNLVASLQAVEAIKLLTGRQAEVNRHLVHIDAWSGRFVNVNIASTFEKGDCPCCSRGEFDYLEGDRTGMATTLCGRDAVQVNPGRPTTISFSAIAKRLEPVAAAEISQNRFMLRVQLEDCLLTLFPDGRAIIKGTDSPDRARTLYAKYIGM